MEIQKIKDLANTLAEKEDADVLLYNGEIERPFDDELLDLCLNAERRKNVFLFLCTHGGNPDAAYRMARCLQDNYEKFTIFISGKCKSSGTLIALGAHEVVMTAHAELGPLDIQLGKKDELFETDSGLTVLNALSELENKAFELFENSFIKLKYKSEGRITLKTATSIANELAIGLMAPIMSQIDPIHVGQVSRAMKIGKEYGRRLSAISKNLQEGALATLVDTYPSHGFVIDRKEADELFSNVRGANEDEFYLIKELGVAARNQNPYDPILTSLSTWKKKEIQNEGNRPENGEQEQSSGEQAVGELQGNGEAGEQREGVVAQLHPRQGG